MEIDSKIEQLLLDVFPILFDVNNYNISGMPSLRKTIDSFSPDLVYGKVIDFFIEKSVEINLMDDVVMRAQDSRIDVSYR